MAAMAEQVQGVLEEVVRLLVSPFRFTMTKGVLQLVIIAAAGGKCLFFYFLILIIFGLLTRTNIA